MGRFFDIIKWRLIQGRGNQNFLGAKWVERVLNRSSDERKRVWALRLLSLSPHYFINWRDQRDPKLSNDEYFEQLFDEALASRRKIYDQILKTHLKESDVVMDFGCGPGFVSKALSPNVSQVYGIDISTGALSCARILNSADNIEYIVGDNADLPAIPDGSIDAVVSIAMAQHVTNEILDAILKTCHKKLKPGGKLIFHVQLNDDTWRTEDEWKGDASLKGKLKYRYGLHCFGRSDETYREIFKRHGFSNIEMIDLSKITTDRFDDVCSQHLAVAIKAG